MRSLLILVSVILLTANALFAQQDPHFTMYMYNRQALNPAYTGALEATNLTALFRTQWVGIKGAPNTGTFSASGYIDKIWSGIGGVLIGDKLGPLSSFGGLVQYSFHIPISQRAKLGVGLEGGLLSKSLVATWIYNTDSGIDPVTGAPDVEYKQSGMVGDLGRWVVLPFTAC